MLGTHVMRVAWYRFRCTWSDRWTGYLALVLLLGLVGGLAMGSVAAARRTQAAFSDYLASTNPSDLTVLSGLYGAPGSRGYDPALLARIAALPHVRHVASYAGLNATVVGPSGIPQGGYQGLTGSIDGEFFGTDRPTVVQGRMASPDRADEVVIDAKGTPGNIGVGMVAPMSFFTNAQQSAPDWGTRPVKPYLTVNVKIVGKVIYSSEQTQDEVDTLRDGGALFTPALVRKLTGCCANFTQTAVQLDPGASVAAVEAGIQQLLPRGFPIEFYVTSLTAAKAERAIEPTSIALAVFGGIAALAALIIAGQVIGRQLRLDAGDLGTLRALGASPAVTVGDGLPGIFCAVVAGALLAVAVAVAASPLGPLGAVRAVYPYPGVAFDWTVLGGGAAALTGVLWLAALAMSYRRAPHRAARRGQRTRPAAAVRAVRASSLPVSAAEGIRLALDPGSDKNKVPVRAAILGTVLAMIVVVATVTFGASLQTLVSHPALYGWNWTYDLSSGVTYIQRAHAAALLDHDPDVAAWTGIYYGTARIDGQTVPVIGMSPGAPVGPPMLSGHALDGRDEVVLGRATLRQLGKRIGDEVTVRDGGARPFRLRVVGTATLPSIGVQGTLHTEMGVGAVVPFQLFPGARASEPNEILVTLRPGADAVAAKKTLQKLVPEAEGGVVIPVQRPAEIVNYRSMGTTPALLAAALAVGAISSLGLTLLTSVRRRRKDLALLKTLGFTRRQLAATVAWQSTAAVAVGTVIGVPLGIALGRFLWDLFAAQISVVPQPTVPGLTVIVICAAGLVIANLVAAIPGRVAGRTPAAALLRAE
jgi:hypothetical protein